MLNRIQKSVKTIRKYFKNSTDTNIAVVLGSGLGDFIQQVEVVISIPFGKIPYFKKTTVDGHEGKLILAKYADKNILILQGRYHFYEGYTMEEITYPIRVLKFLGIKTLFLSNACGGMNPDYSIGDLMIITDHINLLPNPLIGKHIPEFGARFPDMSAVYDKELVKYAVEIAAQKNIKVHRGVYVGVSGPTYETEAEYKFFRYIGGDVVGMSTVPEVIVARQIGIRCFALSVITDLGIPGKIEYLSHEMVQRAASDAEPNLAVILLELIQYT